MCTGGYVWLTFRTCLPMGAVVKTMYLKLSNLGWCLNHNFIFPLSTLLCKTWHFQFSPLFSRRAVEVVLRHSGVWTSWCSWCYIHRMAYTKYCDLLLWFLLKLFANIPSSCSEDGGKLVWVQTCYVSESHKHFWFCSKLLWTQAAAKAWAMKFQWRVGVW